jgi:hypothetical protein
LLNCGPSIGVLTAGGTARVPNSLWREPGIRRRDRFGVLAYRVLRCRCYDVAKSRVRLPGAQQKHLTDRLTSQRVDGRCE